ncbi:CcmD family protein [Marinoscillum sp. 108]|uniref:CcmD family protein n=1 Tax=Marinoscillum luteum TaxID=861051 RepID=A0ABW7NCC9_9BACT|nr:hypothetical protein [Marinoscillum sp. 108]
MYLLPNLLNSLGVVLSTILLQIPMADTFRSEGKIYVVLAVVLIILGGLFYYLLRIDRKLKKLEEDINKK